MRTAEETAIELYRIANDVNVEYAQNTFQHMDVDEKKPWLRLAEYGMNKYDEAVAHGMTLAAATAKPVAASGSLADYRELPHVRARKTK